MNPMLNAAASNVNYINRPAAGQGGRAMGSMIPSAMPGVGAGPGVQGMMPAMMRGMVRPGMMPMGMASAMGPGLMTPAGLPAGLGAAGAMRAMPGMSGMGGMARMGGMPGMAGMTGMTGAMAGAMGPAGLGNERSPLFLKLLGRSTEAKKAKEAKASPESKAAEEMRIWASVELAGDWFDRKQTLQIIDTCKKSVAIQRTAMLRFMLAVLRQALVHCHAVASPVDTDVDPSTEAFSNLPGASVTALRVPVGLRSVIDTFSLTAVRSRAEREARLLAAVSVRQNYSQVPKLLRHCKRFPYPVDDNDAPMAAQLRRMLDGQREPLNPGSSLVYAANSHHFPDDVGATKKDTDQNIFVCGTHGDVTGGVGLGVQTTLSGETQCSHSGGAALTNHEAETRAATWGIFRDELQWLVCAPFDPCPERVFYRTHWNANEFKLLNHSLQSLLTALDEDNYGSLDIFAKEDSLNLCQRVLEQAAMEFGGPLGFVGPRLSRAAHQAVHITSLISLFFKHRVLTIYYNALRAANSSSAITPASVKAAAHLSYSPL